MSEVKSKVECIRCGAVLPDGLTSPCPECGKKGRKISVDLVDEINVTDHIKWEKRKEFYEKRPLALSAVIGITLGAPFLGLVLVGWVGVIFGLALGVAVYLIGPIAITKVREVERGGCSPLNKLINPTPKKQGELFGDVTSDLSASPLLAGCRTLGYVD